MNYYAHSLPRLAACLSLSVLAACATVDLDLPKDASFAVQTTSETFLGEITDRYETTHPGQSGFQLQIDGVDSLAARLAASDAAELSIDVQYYLIKDDLVGYVFLDSLLAAADRGVRVRLLLDDIFTSGFDPGFAALDSHPYIEVRLFNPWASRKNRFADLFNYSQLNRRMHSKSFTVDNELTIVGGRNIADEYYGASNSVNFGDIDVMGIGPVVNEVSQLFDDFWNSRFSAPVAVFVDMPDSPDAALEELRLEIAGQLESVQDSQYANAVNEDFERYLNANEDLFTWSPFVLAYDSPDKADKQLAADAVSIVDPMLAAIDAATSELVIVSPYFVPQKKGIEFFQGLRDRGLKITVITNSLAANNHLVVHGGYAPSRKPLLKMGVEIYEVKANAKIGGLERAGTEDSSATLHSKVFVIDRRSTFIGSFNWDPRSININTELGIIIQSRILAGTIMDRLEQGEVANAYQVVLDKNGNLRWIDRSGGGETIINKEPDTSWGKRTLANLSRLLPIRSQL